MTTRIIGWVQNENPDKPNIIYNNGDIIDSTNSKYTLLYQEIVNRKAYQKVYDQNGLSVYRKKNQVYLIYSNFRELDFSGRRIAYMCLIHSKIDDIILSLKKFASGVNKSLDTTDLIEIEQTLGSLRKKKRMISLSIISVLAIMIIIYMVLN